MLYPCMLCTQPTAWDRDPITNPESVRGPSESQRQQYKQYEEEKKEAYRLQNLNAYLDEVSVCYRYILEKTRRESRKY